MRRCSSELPSLLLFILLIPPGVLPRQQRKQKPVLDEAQEAWAQRLSKFDRTSGERMWEANN